MQRQATEAQRSVSDEVVRLLATVVPAEDDRLRSELEQELGRIQALDDASLWKLARTRLPARTAKRMQALQFKRQREGLSDEERQVEVALAEEYDRRMLIRAKVLLLLKQRGHDVSELVSRP